MSSKKESVYSRVFNAKTVLFLVAVILMMVLVSGIAMAAHTSTASVTPHDVAGGTSYAFEVEVCNDGASANAVDEVRIYEYGDFSGFDCKDEPGWERLWIESKRACHYVALNSGFRILPGQCVIFDFDAITPETECCRAFEFETRDTLEIWKLIYGDVCIDPVPPTTDLTITEPKKEDNGIIWIDSATDIILLGRDNVGQHDNGVVSTEYRVSGSLGDQFCNDCDNWNISLRPQMPAWQPYAGPFGIPDESCHVFEYRSVDGVGNEEGVKWECVFADHSAPSIEMTSGSPFVTGSGFASVTPATDLTFWCDDPEPHPAEGEEFCFMVTYDLDPFDLTQDYCTKYSGDYNVTTGYCCVPATPQNHFVFNFNVDEDSVHTLDYYCRDAVMKESAPGQQVYHVDTNPPTITKTMLGDDHIGYRDAVENLDACPPVPGENDECFVRDNGVNGVRIDVTDGDNICASGIETCNYELWWQTDVDTCIDEFSGTHLYNFDTGQCFVEGGEFGIEGKDILFHEDSTHELYIYCEDVMGNSDYDTEYFKVDSTPPFVFKEYGTPSYVDPACWDSCVADCSSEVNCTRDCAHANCMWWLKTTTPVSLFAGDEKVGVDEIKYRVSPSLGNQFCENCANWMTMLRPDMGVWNTYIDPFVIPDESCHVIEYTAVDLLGNGEELDEILWQCVYIDETVPDVWKKIGAPNASSDDPNIYYISGQTPITMYCEDQGPHPVNEVSLWYRYQFSDDCVNWGDWVPAAPEDCPDGYRDGWCDPTEPGVVEKTIYFPQDSCHQLEYYCEDILGNKGEVYSEIDIVDSVPPVIEKTIIGPQTDCPPAPEPEICEKWDCFGEMEKDFFVTGRYGNQGTLAQTWELAIWENTGGGEVVRVDDGADGSSFDWTSGVAEDFSSSYDPSDGSVVFTIGAKTLEWTYDSGKAFESIVLMAKGNADGNIAELTNVHLNGVPISDLTSDNGGTYYWGYIIPLTDADQLTGFTITGKATLTWTGTNTKDEQPAFHVFAMNTHDLIEDCFQIDGVTNISVMVTDPIPHPVGQVTCEWGYWWYDTYYGPFFEDVFPFLITGMEESEHLLDITCWDGLGNEVVDVEEFIVDHTPPETTKTEDLYFEDNGAKWVSSKTNFTLTATDDIGPHDSGVKETQYRISGPLADNFCYSCGDWMTMLRPDMGDWSTYIDPFTIPEDSCHVIEYRSIDNVGKTEDIKWQCVFVDNSAPTPSKVVGEPKTPWDGKDAYFYDIEEFCETPDNCWKVTQLTPIHLECNDPDPHPVDHETVCFNVELDAVDETERYCEHYTGIMEDDGYCCLPYELDNFYFKEETEHNLKYYCVDALGNGNKEAVDDEKFKVEGTRFDIPLFKKWNLISVPFVLMDDDPEVVFKDIKDDIISVWAYDPNLEMCGLDWCVWTPGEGPDNLKVRPGWGYWVLVSTDIDEEPLWLVLGGSLFNQGPVAPPSRDLQPGWNLIGYYGTSWELYDWMDFDFTCGDAFSFPDRYVYGDKVYCSLNSLVDTQEGYPKWSGVWSFMNCGDHQTTWLGLNACADQSVQQALDRMYAGRGYWIEIDVEENYAPSTNCIWNSDFQCRWTGGGIIP